MASEILKRCELFRDFTPVGLDILSKIAKPRVLLAGKILFAEGTQADALYIIAEGRFRVVVKAVDGTDVPIASLGAGEHLGDLALLAPGKKTTHLCTVVAEADSKILEIAQADFQALTKEKPQACMKLLLALASEFGRKSVDAREPLKTVLSRYMVR